MKRILLSLMAISLVAVGCFSFAQEKDWIEYNSDEGTITVYSGSYGIVIQDRNLGATMTGGGKNAPVASYGNYYQWGNNYGFSSDPSVIITKTSSLVDTLSYGPKNPYSSNTFVIGYGDWSSVTNNNLWGGEGDNGNNGWGLSSINPITGRQGPCDSGYHIPSLGEINELIVIWYNNRYNADLTTENYLFYLTGIATTAAEPSLSGIDTPISIAFSEDMLIPFSTYRWGDDGTVETSTAGIEGEIWSSSPDDEEDTYGTYLLLRRTTRSSAEGRERFFKISAQAIDRTWGLPIRCFKDERVYRDASKTLTLNVMSGENLVSTGVSFTSDEPLTSGQVLEAIDWLSSEIELATGYHFEWYADDGGVETGFDLDAAISEGTITSNLALTGKIEPNKYSISFLNENGAEIMSSEFIYDQEATLPANTSTKEGYTFKGWKDGQGNTYEDGASVKNLTTENGAILGFTPIREKKESKPSGSSGGGGRGRGSKSIDSQTDTHGAADDEKTDSDSENNNEDIDGLDVVNYNPDLPAEQQTLSDGLTTEMHRAYKFAYKHGITTMPTILDADMFGPLDRISMAKMLSQYAINVLGKTPDTSIEVPAFPDITPELNEEFGNAVTLAYQLGIMGINIDKFRPFDLVPRSEFGTALSRMLYQLSDGIYEKTDEFYIPHFNKLSAEGIMTVLDPTIEELRGYVMIMLMRSAKKSN